MPLLEGEGLASTGTGIAFDLEEHPSFGLCDFTHTPLSRMMTQEDLSIHPAAKADIDAGARLLLGEVSLVENHPKHSEPFASDQHVAATITDADMVGEPTFGDVDFSGRYVSRYFFRSRETYTLKGDGYQSLRGIADKFLKSKNIRAIISKEKLEEIIFSWVAETYKETTKISPSDFVLVKIDELRRNYTVWIPISNLIVQSELAFSVGSIKPITKKMVDDIRSMALLKAPDHADTINSVLDRELIPVQGFAAVVVNLIAESDYAYDLALEIADTAVALLGICSLAAVTPWRTYICAVRGSELVRKYQGISFSEDGNFSLSSGVRESHLDTWRLSDQEKEAHLREGLQDLLGLTVEDGLSDFQLRVRSAALTYSRAISSPRMSDRVAQSFSALETLFLKDGSEPIQHSMSERIAFGLSSKVEERKRTVSTLKAAYKLRSQYVHHGISSSEEQDLEEFVTLAHSAMRLGLANVQKFKRHAEFIDALDNVKFGG